MFPRNTSPKTGGRGSAEKICYAADYFGESQQPREEDFHHSLRGRGGLFGGNVAQERESCRAAGGTSGTAPNLIWRESACAGANLMNEAAFSAAHAGEPELHGMPAPIGKERARTG